MIPVNRLMVAAIAATIVVSGCGPAAIEADPPAAPKPASFEGKVETKYIGTWVGSNGNSTIRLKKDGGFESDTIGHSLKGKSEVAISGEWLAKDDKLTWKYNDKDGKPVVLQYVATVSGDTLKLAQESGRLKTTYTKK